MFIMLAEISSILLPRSLVLNLSRILVCLLTINLWQCLMVAPVYSSRPMTASFRI